jgi:hypothetical protein
LHRVSARFELAVKKKLKLKVKLKKTKENQNGNNFILDSQHYQSLMTTLGKCAAACQEEVRGALTHTKPSCFLEIEINFP